MALALVHATARLAIAAIWMWHGLVPKLLYRQIDEQTMLMQAGLPISLLPWVGGAEILLGLLVLMTWNVRAVFAVNAVVMVVATVALAVRSPAYLTAAFNPVTLNFAIIALSLAGWIAARRLPSSRLCVRVTPRTNDDFDLSARSRFGL